MSETQVRYRSDDVIDLREPSYDYELAGLDFPRGYHARGFETGITTDVMRFVSTTLAGATYELNQPRFEIVHRRDEHGCQRISITIIDGDA